MSTSTTKPLMTSDQFIGWAMAQPDTFHYELHDGDVVRMPNEASLHGLTKALIARRLANAIEDAGLSCDVYVDAMCVEIGPTTVFEPDIVARCAPRLPDRATKITDPMIVVEVLSPSSRPFDLGPKKQGYLALPSLWHYLVVNPDARAMTHFRRAADGTFTSGPHGTGPLTLDPPGITIDRLFP